MNRNLTENGEKNNDAGDIRVGGRHGGVSVCLWVGVQEWVVPYKV